MTAPRRLDRWRRVAPLLGVALLGAGWVAAPASAQEPGTAERLVLRAVDATDADAVQLVVGWSGDPGDLDGIVVNEDGEAVDTEAGAIEDAGLRSDIAFVFDTSATTDPNALLASAKSAVGALLAELPAGTRAAVISAGGASQLLRGVTDDVGRLTSAVDQLAPGGEGAVLSGVVRGATITSRDGSLPTVVLVTDGVENPTTTVETARGELLAQGAALYVIGLQDGGLDEGAFRSLASESGGRMLVATEPGQIAGLVDELQPELLGLRSVRYASSTGRGLHDLSLSVDQSGTQGSYVAGSLLVGAARVAPRPAIEPGGIEFFRTDLGRYLGFGAALLASVLFAYGVLLLLVREKTALSQALQPYADGYVAGGDGDGDDGGGGAFGHTAFLQRAAAITEGFAQRQGFLAGLEKNLERADLPLRAGEAMFFYAAGMVLVFVAALALTQNFLGTLVVLGLVALAPPAALTFLANRKKKQFEALLPDTLQLLASTLRAGYSMMQGVEAVSQEVSEPMGKELRRVVTEARLGRPLEESLDAVAERMDSGDFAWAVMAIRIQREVGGNLSELLMTVAETMTQRERLRRDVSALTAEGRISAYVLIGLPLGLGGFLFTVNPDYIGKLFDVTMGQIMLGAAVVMMVVGYVWMMKIIKIEI